MRRAIILILAGLCTIGAQAQTADEFFRERSLVLLVGGGAGGSVDIYGRLVARHIVRFLPGNPSIVVRNLPAAGGVQAFMTMGTTAPRDGSTFVTSARGPLTDPILSDRSAQYDPRKFIWIGAMNEDSSLCFTRKDSLVRTLADARRLSATMASTGALAESAKFPLAINAIAGTQFKVITGYRGAAETRLAVERGEVDGQCTTIGSLMATQPQVVTSGEFNLIVQVGERRSKLLPDTPNVGEFARDDEDRRLLDIIVKPLAMTSAFALPEGVPANRVKIWRDAFARTIADAEFVAEGNKVGLDVVPHGGESVQRRIEDLYALPPKTVARARTIFGYSKSVQ